jgi:hypothetical protein
LKVFKAGGKLFNGVKGTKRTKEANRKTANRLFYKVNAKKSVKVTAKSQGVVFWHFLAIVRPA